MIKKIHIYFTIALIVFLLHSTHTTYAHGVTYETKQLEGNKIRITLSMSNQSEAKGIAISYFYLKNGKTLNIGYEIKPDAPKSAYMDYDLVSAIPPIRIVLNNISAGGNPPLADIKGIEAEEYIRHLHDAGIVNGRDGNLFKPNDSISRAEFMVLMVKALKLEGTAQNTNGYTDISNHWAKNMLLLGAKHGLISGYEDKTLRPDSPITIAQVSTIISRAFKFKTTKNGIYLKLKSGMWYSSQVKKMFDTGILDVSDSIYKNFDEQANISRANCAMMISRALSTY